MIRSMFKGVARLREWAGLGGSAQDREAEVWRLRQELAEMRVQRDAFMESVTDCKIALGAEPGTLIAEEATRLRQERDDLRGGLRLYRLLRESRSMDDARAYVGMVQQWEADHGTAAGHDALIEELAATQAERDQARRWSALWHERAREYRRRLRGPATTAEFEAAFGIPWAKVTIDTEPPTPAVVCPSADAVRAAAAEAERVTLKARLEGLTRAVADIADSLEWPTAEWAETCTVAARMLKKALADAEAAPQGQDSPPARRVEGPGLFICGRCGEPRDLLAGETAIHGQTVCPSCSRKPVATDYACRECGGAPIDADGKRAMYHRSGCKVLARLIAETQKRPSIEGDHPADPDPRAAGPGGADLLGDLRSLINPCDGKTLADLTTTNAAVPPPPPAAPEHCPADPLTQQWASVVERVTQERDAARSEARAFRRHLFNHRTVSTPEGEYVVSRVRRENWRAASVALGEADPDPRAGRPGGADLLSPSAPLTQAEVRVALGVAGVDVSGEDPAVCTVGDLRTEEDGAADVAEALDDLRGVISRGAALVVMRRATGGKEVLIRLLEPHGRPSVMFAATSMRVRKTGETYIAPACPMQTRAGKQT